MESLNITIRMSNGCHAWIVFTIAATVLGNGVAVYLKNRPPADKDNKPLDKIKGRTFNDESEATDAIKSAGEDWGERNGTWVEFES